MSASYLALTMKISFVFFLKVLGLLACSKGGLSETELQFLLSDDLTEAVPMMMMWPVVGEH